MKEELRMKFVTDDEVIQRLKGILQEFDYKERIWFDYEMISKEVNIFNYQTEEDICVIYQGKINYLNNEEKYKSVCERLREEVEAIKADIDATEDLIIGETDYLDYVE